MYAVSIIGLDREGNEHYVDIPDLSIPILYLV